MMSLRDIRPALAVLAANGYMFRGETCQRESIHPTLGRLRTQFLGQPERIATIRGQAYTILRRTHMVKSLVFPGITTDEWYALLRHYGWPVPFLDVTFDPEVAIWFALLTRHPAGTPSAIYAVPPGLPAYVRVISHEDLAQNQNYLKLNCRWTIQRGGALVPAGWPDMTAAEEFDMLSLPGLKTFLFSAIPGDHAFTGDLLSTQGDGIASKLSDLLTIVSQVVGGIDKIDPCIRDRIQSLS
jgi:hypothetical protein